MEWNKAKKFKFAAFSVSFCFLLSVVSGASVSGTALKSSIAKPLWKMQSQSAANSPTGYSPVQIKNAYGFDSSFGTGKGKVIAIITAYGSQSLSSDLSVFDSQYNLPTANLTIHDCGVTDSDPTWALETTLDVEWAHAIAPDAKLLVVEAASDYSDDLLDAIDYAVDSGAQIVSMSWGSSEDRSQIIGDQHFSNSNVVFLAAAGDDGEGALWPASSTNVIAVGGTTLNLDSNGNRSSETAWSESGGGESAYEAQPSWQSTFGINSSSRACPDVAFDADPATGVSVYCSTELDGSSGWYKIGGTSLSTPAWAGIIADLNQSTSYIKNAGSFYTLAGGTGYTNADNFFNDITAGSNGNSALSGYDEVTGLGTPQISNLAPRGVSYSAHVQSAGWQPYVNDGAEAGTDGKSLRVEALKIKLTGDVPEGASIIYKAHVQSIGWQKAVSDGALAGTTGLSKRVEALRIALSGLTGYKVAYRVHIQHYGWLGWQTTKNGTNIESAGIAGTVGKSLRIEAVEIKIEKAVS